MDEIVTKVPYVVNPEASSYQSPTVASVAQSEASGLRGSDVTATILSFEHSSDSCSILHTLKQPADFEMLGEGEAGGIRLIRMHGERFVAEHSETKLLNIGTDHASPLLQSKFYSFMGANLFSCFTHDRPGLRPRKVHVNKDNLVASSDFGEWFERVLLEEAVASTRWIIHDD